VGKKYKRLRKEHERLQVRLQQAEAILEAQKKLAQLFGLVSTSESDEPK